MQRILPRNRDFKAIERGEIVVGFISRKHTNNRTLGVPGHFFKGRVRTKKGYELCVEFDRPVYRVTHSDSGRDDEFHLREPFIMSLDEYEELRTKPQLRAQWVQGYRTGPLGEQVEEFLTAFNNSPPKF